MPTLLRFVGRLGLNAAMGMELFCLIGIVLSFVAFVSRSCRNFVFFIAMWMMYLSVFQVSFWSFLLVCCVGRAWHIQSSSEERDYEMLFTY